MMDITEEDAKKLRKLYNKAVAEKQNQFYFKGQGLLVPYAKYLLEHLENIFKR